ncbi:Uma2 family endonuclease [Leptolyngbya sp. FACHB-671]|uniref:Uma2 family endonuclease n=1 Tax=Leptolyngbya sp. FACHB-671 TaxID=2692812 RepID=UPI00321FFB88
MARRQVSLCVIVEFLSPGTEADALGRFHSAVTTATSPELNGESSQNIRPLGKLEVYEQYLRVPHYIVYSRYTRQLRYFKLEGGQYQEQPVGEVAPFIWLDDLEIGLGIWQGEFEGVPDSWLRWCDREGNWLLTDTEQEQFEKEQERLEKERERAAREQERLEKEQERAAKEQVQSQLLQTARNLLATGMELEQVIAIAGLTEEQVRALDNPEP